MPTSTLRLASDTATRPLPKRVRLNQSIVGKATCPAGKSFASIYDSEQPRLVLLVTPNGAKTFYAYAKEHGRPIRWKLGSADALTVEQARRACRAALSHPGGLTALSNDRDRVRKIGTVAELFAAWRDDYGKRKKSAAQDVATWNRYCSTLASKPAVQVARADIAALHRKIGEKRMPALPTKNKKKKRVEATAGGKYAANRTLALLRTMFEWAAESGLLPANPAAGVKMYDEASRERFLQPDELPKFIDAIESEPNPTLKDLFRVLLATGARRGNVQAMRWADVDLHNRQWRIPAAKSKSGDAVVVPLHDDALAVLLRRNAERESDEWVFASHGKSGHVVHFYSAWEKLLKRAKLEGIRPHDVRRTLGSYMAMGGSSDRIIATALGQKSTAATGVYARLRVDPIREAMAVAQATMTTLAKTKGIKR